RVVLPGRVRPSAAVVAVRVRPQQRGEPVAGAAPGELVGDGGQDRRGQRPGGAAGAGEGAAGEGGGGPVPGGGRPLPYGRGKGDGRGVRGGSEGDAPRAGRRVVGIAQQPGVSVQPLSRWRLSMGGLSCSRFVDRVTAAATA